MSKELDIKFEKTEEGMKVITKDQPLEFEGRTIGKRYTEDIYQAEEVQYLIDSLAKQKKDMLKNKVDVEKNRDMSAKRFDNKELNKIKEYVAMLDKAGAYKQYIQSVEQLRSIDEAVKKIDSEISKLENIKK